MDGLMAHFQTNEKDRGVADSSPL